MGKKTSIFFVILIFFSIIGYGLIDLSSNLPKFIKVESKIKMDYGSGPYEITMNIGHDVIYTGWDVVSNIKEGAGKGISKLSKKVETSAYNFKYNTYKGIERLLSLN